MTDSKSVYLSSNLSPATNLIIMLLYNNKIFNTRKELKKFLGGTNAYNKILREGDIQFINNLNIAINEKRRIKANP